MLALRETSVELELLGDVLLLELGVVELPYVELVPPALEPVPVVPVPALLEGLVEDVVFKLPLVFSFVVLVLLGLLLEVPYVEPLEVEGEVDELELVPYVEPEELEGVVVLDGEL